MIKIKVLVVIFFILVLSIARSIGGEEDLKLPKTEQTLNQRWQEIELSIRSLTSSLSKTMMAFAVHSAHEMDLSTNCTRGLMTFLSGIKSMKGWAFKMLDASGKIPNGVYSGSINSLGEYDQCVETIVPKYNFQGQYCTVNMKPPLPERKPFVSSDLEIPELINITKPDTFLNDLLKHIRYQYHLNIRTSVCIPSTCSEAEVEMIANKITLFDVDVTNCEIKVDKLVFSRRQLVIMVFLSILILLGIAATITDVRLQMMTKSEITKTLSIPLKCLMCFSFYTNTIRLLKKDDSPDTIKIFHGMKVITILWVILNHTYYYVNFQAFSNLLKAREMGKELLFQIVINGYLNVETFFFISSVLIAYGVMKMKEKKLNVFLYIFRRFWRLTPPFMFVIACVHLLPLIGSGPFWKETIVEKLAEKCQANWWANLLYINNFLPVNETCLEWLWYIPVDTHLYLLSLVVLIPLKQNPRLAFILNGVIFVGSLIVMAAMNVYYGLHPTGIYVFNHPDDINYFVSKGYFRTYLHCSTYCIGIAVGYFIATRPKTRISLRLNIIGWIAAFGFSLIVLYGVYDWNQGNVPSLLVSTIFTCTNKVVWSLALSFVTIACMTGNGGFATTFLSWQAFVPFGRLTYMAYLIHPIIQYVHIGSARSLFRVEHRTILYMYLGNVVLAFMCAYAFSLLFESPFMALEKVFFEAMRSSNNKKKESTPSKNIVNKLKNSDQQERNCIYAINFKQVEINA